MNGGKLLGKNQNRNGSPARRLLEFRTVKDQVARDPERLIRRFNRNLLRKGECRLYQGTCDRNGYPRINFNYKGKHVTILACRVFLILKLCKPIPRGHEAAHVGCKDRRCVAHVESIHYTINANTSEKPPF